MPPAHATRLRRLLRWENPRLSFAANVAWVTFAFFPHPSASSVASMRRDIKPLHRWDDYVGREVNILPYQRPVPLHRPLPNYRPPSGNPNHRLVDPKNFLLYPIEKKIRNELLREYRTSPGRHEQVSVQPFARVARSMGNFMSDGEVLSRVSLAGPIQGLSFVGYKYKDSDQDLNTSLVLGHSHSGPSNRHFQV